MALSPQSIEFRNRREAVFYLIFESLFSDCSPEEILETAESVDNFDVDKKARKRFLAICEKADELDKLIAEFSEKRVLERVPKISTAILRQAFYEILYDPKTHENIAISEAVRLATDFTLEADIKFINGVLGNFVRNRKSETPETTEAQA
ncbi:MAG: transcription antitermination factor NusB [Ruminococcus sp.]|jgi:N utilization substance protein B|nr:transcription antitermination factor NusB [Ruminococcus sp.]